MTREAWNRDLVAVGVPNPQIDPALYSGRRFESLDLRKAQLPRLTLRMHLPELITIELPSLRHRPHKPSQWTHQQPDVDTEDSLREPDTSLQHRARHETDGEERS